MNITCGFISKQGDRELNEDSIYQNTATDSGIYAVADGLGGHERGEVASQTVIQTIKEIFESTDSGALNLSDTFELCQQKLLQKQNDLGARNEMKTTLTVLSVSENCITWGHVGDSRLYAFNNNRVKTRTLDHSVPQMLVLSGDIPERKIRNHPDRNLLLKVMGINWEEPQYEISDTYSTSDYTAFLLCSDGFWELINERQMCSCLRKSKTVQEWIDMMTAIVEKNGKGKDMDNYSAVAVWLRC